MTSLSVCPFCLLKCFARAAHFLSARRAIAVTLLLSIAGNTGAFAAENEAFATALASIKLDQLKRHVEVLADDTFEGREAGSRGGRAAALYIVKELEKNKLKPLGDEGTWFQNFEGSSRNILGLLEGSDPQLKDQVLILGAHYDHVGYGSPSNSYGPIGNIHNGADDNASGVSGLIEVLEAFRQLPNPPARSILFAFWDGEEKGLNGSRYWMAHPTISKSRMAFALNMDMIGRFREKQGLEVYGTRTLLGSRQAITLANRTTNLPLVFTWAMKPDSDHYTFYSNNIPVIMFHTGLHDNYHRPSDDVHLVNYDGMLAVTRMVFEFTYDLAQRPVLTTFRESSRRESDGNKTLFERKLGNPEPRFGVTWVRDPQTGVFAVTNVVIGGAAERGGLKVGDEILAIDDWPVSDEPRLRREMLYAPSPTKIQVRRAGEAEPVTLAIEPAGTPVRIGLRWREDEAEPGVLFVTQVVPHSSAAMGGVLLADRIYRLNGEPFANSADFIARSQQINAEAVLTLERNGCSRDVKLELLPVKE